MLRTELGLGGSSAFTWSVALAIVAACNVYDPSMLTGGSGGKGGTSGGGGGGSGDGGTSGGNGGSSGATGGRGGSGTGGASGTNGTGGSNGATGGTTSTGGAAAGGEGGEGDTGGNGGAAGSGGSATGGAGNGGSSGSGGMCGVCGCDVPETDTDGDGVFDCMDTCMGFDDAHCTVLENGLAHRYSFGGTGTAVMDSKGTAHGTAVNATLDGSGTLTLTGGNTSTPPYVDLPNGLLSVLTNATFEAWVIWNQSGTTGRNWQRIFDFGTSGTEDAQVQSSTTSMSYLFLTPRASVDPMGLRAAFTSSGSGAETVAGVATAMETGVTQHLVVVVDEQNGELSVFLNGSLQASAAFSGSLSQISDVNNWLGRSQYSGDYEFIGVFDEFRIYGVALTIDQITTSNAAGPNAAFLD